MGYYYYFHFMENDEAEKNQMSCSGYRSEDQIQAITEHRATGWVGGALWPNLPQTGQSCELDSEHPPSGVHHSPERRHSCGNWHELMS